MQKINEAVRFIHSKIQNITGETALILGSGLGYFAEEAESKIRIPTKQIPFYPISTVEGHEGSWIFGEINSLPILAVKGRIHLYEGYSAEAISFPIRLMRELGIKTIIITNAAGGINRNFKPGDIMIIEDHINLSFKNPLRGKNESTIGPRFPDMSSPYSKELIQLAIRVAEKEAYPIQTGVYCGVMGPNYESKAEIRFFHKIGADAVGMSTVNECITAIHCGIKVLGLSCITNMAAGLSPAKLNHNEVTETANKSKDIFVRLIKNILSEIKDLNI